MVSSDVRVLLKAEGERKTKQMGFMQGREVGVKVKEPEKIDSFEIEMSRI